MAGEEPPCATCPAKPPDLHHENEPAWRIWSICNRYGRPWDTMGGNTLPLAIEPILDVCRAYGESRETFERVLLIEELMWPYISERNNQGAPDQEHESQG